MALERIIELTPAWDKRDPDPKKDYGISCVSLRMVVKGPEGAVQFLLLTNWHLKEVQKELDSKHIGDERFTHLCCHPLPADLGYHSPVPMYDGQHVMGATVIHHDEMEEVGTPKHPLQMPKITYDGTPRPCEYLDGKPCYYDGSSLAADNVYEILLKGGSDAVWAYLEEFYAETFLGKENSTEKVESNT